MQTEPPSHFLHLCLLIFSGNANSADRFGRNPADARHHALAVLVSNVHLGQKIYITGKNTDFQRKSVIYPKRFPPAAFSARRHRWVPVYAQTLSRVHRPERWSKQRAFLGSYPYIWNFHLLNTSFFLGFSRIPLSSAAMATIPLQKELLCWVLSFCFVWRVIWPSKLQVLLGLDNGKHIHMLRFLLNYITWIKFDQGKDLDQEKRTWRTNSST